MTEELKRNQKPRDKIEQLERFVQWEKDNAGVENQHRTHIAEWALHEIIRLRGELAMLRAWL